MNLYATLDDVKHELGLTSTSDDAVLMDCLEAASRWVDGECGRTFFVETGTRYFDGAAGPELLIDDCLALTAMTGDSEQDGTYDGETWTEDDDYWLLPSNSWPKMRLRVTPFGDEAFSAGARYYKLVGNWGYGDGERAAPYDASGITVTVATAAGTTVTLSAEGTIRAGHTILVESEQMYVSAVTGDGSKTATVERGVNGTTAAAHSAAAASIYTYPQRVRRAVLTIASEIYGERDRAGLSGETIGSYKWQAASMCQRRERNIRILGPLVKWVAV